MLASIHKAVFQFNSKVRPFQPAAGETVWQSNSNYRLIHNGISCKVSSLYWIGAPGESLPVFTIFSLDVLCSYWTDVAEKIRYIMTLSYFPDVLPYYFFQNVKFCSRKIPLFLLCVTVPCAAWFRSGPRFNIKMTPYQYRKSHCGDKTISRPSYLHNGISYTGNRTSLYWIGALLPNEKYEYELFIACSIVAEDQQTGDWTFKSV